MLYLSTAQPTQLEHEIAETIRLRVERMVCGSPAGDQEVADKLGIEPAAVHSMLGRWWSIATALRVADQLEFEELRRFQSELQSAAV